jgi:hypothetical protein
VNVIGKHGVMLEVVGNTCLADTVLALYDHSLLVTNGFDELANLNERKHLHGKTPWVRYCLVGTD